MIDQLFRMGRFAPNRYHIMVSLICMWVSLANAQYQNLLHKTFAQRAALLAVFNVEDLRTKDSVTLFNTINRIRELAIDNGDDDLLLETKLMRAGYFYYRDKQFSAQFTLAVIDSLRQEGRQRKKLWLEIMTENMEALYNFYMVQNYELGFEHHQRVYDLVKNLSPKVFPQKQSCLYQIAGEYYFFNDYREAVFYDLQAKDADPPQGLHPFYQPLTVLNTLGLCYQKLNMLDSSDYYFNKTIALSKVLQKKDWGGIAGGNLGYNLFLKKDYIKAAPLLQKDVALAVEYQDWGLASGSQMVLTHISLLTGQIGEAGKRLALARLYVMRSHQYQRLEDLYPLVSKYYSLTHQFALAAKYLDSSMLVKDSLDRKLSALQLMRASQKVDQERHQAEIDNIESQKTINILERNLLILAVAGMIAAAILLYRRQEKKDRLQQEQALKAREELEIAARQLNDFARNILEKNEMIQMLQRQSGGPDHETIIKLQHSTLLTDEDWNYFCTLFEKVHPGYLQRLREKMAGLTPAETRFMTLTRLGLSGKEMAAMLGIGADAIRQYRTRLRRKLDIADDVDFEGLAAQI
jgi:DNA-binding CsgD family transcriptional regulator